MSATANLPLCRWKINIAAHWMLEEDVSSSLFLMRRKGHPKPNVMLFKIPVLAERNYLTLILVSQYPIHLHNGSVYLELKYKAGRIQYSLFEVRRKGSLFNIDSVTSLRIDYHFRAKLKKFQFACLTDRR